MRAATQVETSPRPRRRLAAYVGLALGAALAAVVALGEPVVASADQPEVVECDVDVADPVLEDLSTSDTVLAVPYVDGAHCTWLVALHNTGRLPVTITEVVVGHEPGWDGLLTFEATAVSDPVDEPRAVSIGSLRGRGEVTLRPGQHVLVGLRAVMDNCELRGELGTEYHHTWPVRYRLFGIVPRTTHVRIVPHAGVILERCDPA